jgi:hypothetical protein
MSDWPGRDVDRPGAADYERPAPAGQAAPGPPRAEPARAGRISTNDASGRRHDKPFAVFGTVYSSSTVANMDIARQAGVPQFTGSESVIITQKGNDNIFLTSFTQEIGMAKFVRWLTDDMFVQFLKERGKTPVVEISTEVQQADFTPELTKVRASGATHVVVYNHEEENARFMIQLRKLGLSVEPVGETTLCAQTTVTPGGAAVNGARCHVGLTAGAPVPLMVDMNRRFQEKYNRVPDHNAFQGLYRRAPPQGRRPARRLVGPGQGARVPARQLLHHHRGAGPPDGRVGERQGRSAPTRSSPSSPRSAG